MRVASSAAVVFAGGFLVAAARTGSAPGAARVGFACGVLAAPFFALREVVVAGVGVDGPVASAIAGGFAGYFGTLFFAGPRWQIISQGAMVMGIGCGLADAVISTIDWRRKVFLVNRKDSHEIVGNATAPAASASTASAVAAAAAVAASGSEQLGRAPGAASRIATTADVFKVGEGSDLRDVKADSSTGKIAGTVVRSPGAVESQRDSCVEQQERSAEDNTSLFFRWPVWLPVPKNNDAEYQDLIRRREATLLALEEEQARIATLLSAIESVKAGNSSPRSPDAELGRSGAVRGKSAMPRAPPPSARA